MDLQLREVIPNDLQRLYRVGPGLAISFCENCKHAGFVKDWKAVSKREKLEDWDSLPNAI